MKAQPMFENLRVIGEIGVVIDFIVRIDPSARYQAAPNTRFSKKGNRVFQDARCVFVTNCPNLTKGNWPTNRY
jgi:hypothetical protein